MNCLLIGLCIPLGSSMAMLFYCFWGFFVLVLFFALDNSEAQVVFFPKTAQRTHVKHKLSVSYLKIFAFCQFYSLISLPNGFLPARWDLYSGKECQFRKGKLAA